MCDISLKYFAKKHGWKYSSGSWNLARDERWVLLWLLGKAIGGIWFIPSRDVLFTLANRTSLSQVTSYAASLWRRYITTFYLNLSGSDMPGRSGPVRARSNRQRLVQLQGLRGQDVLPRQRKPRREALLRGLPAGRGVPTRSQELEGQVPITTQGKVGTSSWWLLDGIQGWRPLQRLRVRSREQLYWWFEENKLKLEKVHVHLWHHQLSYVVILRSTDQRYRLYGSVSIVWLWVAHFIEHFDIIFIMSVVLIILNSYG